MIRCRIITRNSVNNVGNGIHFLQTHMSVIMCFASEWTSYGKEICLSKMHSHLVNGDGSRIPKSQYQPAGQEKHSKAVIFLVYQTIDVPRNLFSILDQFTPKEVSVSEGCIFYDHLEETHSFQIQNYISFVSLDNFFLYYFPKVLQHHRKPVHHALKSIAYF